MLTGALNALWSGDGLASLLETLDQSLSPAWPTSNVFVLSDTETSKSLVWSTGALERRAREQSSSLMIGYS